ncbi:MAG: hypothetical protein M3Q30_25075 [Actinomycetota bacterium]|nr:hypothetical protein [Actinomycetota bacterium]
MSETLALAIATRSAISPVVAPTMTKDSHWFVVTGNSKSVKRRGSQVRLAPRSRFESDPDVPPKRPGYFELGACRSKVRYRRSAPTGEAAMVESGGSPRGVLVAKIYSVEHLARNTNDVIDELGKPNVKMAVVVEGTPSARFSRRVVRGVFDAAVLKQRLADAEYESVIDALHADAIDDDRIKYRQRTVRRKRSGRVRMRVRDVAGRSDYMTYALSPTGIQLASPTGIQLPSGTTTKPGGPECGEKAREGWSKYRCTAVDHHLWWCEDGVIDGRPCAAAASAGGPCPGILEAY